MTLLSHIGFLLLSCTVMFAADREMERSYLARCICRTKEFFCIRWFYSLMQKTCQTAKKIPARNILAGIIVTLERHLHQTG